MTTSFSRSTRPTMGTPIPVRLTTENKAIVAKEADRLGVSKSEVVRRALDRYFKAPVRERR